MSVPPPTYRNTRGCLLSIYLLQQLLVILIILLLVVERICIASGSDMKNMGDNDISHWQRCSVFIAPSLPTHSNPYTDVNFDFNWGVYANREFSKGEIVDISPLTVPIPDRSETIEHSILNDYVYGYWRVIKPKHPTNANAKPTIEKLYSVLFGPDMFYNHHPIEPNIEFTTFGREPDATSGVPYAINPQGFVAKRNIKRGEQLFTSYNGKEDGGTQWFQRRGITMITPPSSSPLSSTTKIEKFDLYSDQYCSKIYSGVGIPSWKDRLLPILPTNYDLPFNTDTHLKWLAPTFDAGLWDAKTKIDVQKGERLEVSTALVLSVEFTKNTAIMPLVYTWKDLHDDHRSALERIHEKDELRLQYQGPDTNWMPMNNITTTITATRTISNFEDLALFPVAGNIGMIRRRTPTSSDAAKANCRLIVHDNNNNNNNNNPSNSPLKHPVGVTIELIAMEDLIAGTNLIVDVIESVATPFEYSQLYRELKLTGQPYNKQIFQHRKQERQRQQRNRINASASTSKISTATAKVEL
mmetsp:Transcript_40298/g.43722  ORF Transcript_40298/g.43722 Transcript_40298/m.43722 type:complete len:526 (+) Transcript_40298:119-1696(+)